MKTKHIFYGLALSSVLSFASCSKTEIDTTTGTDPSASGEPIKVTLSVGGATKGASSRTAADFTDNTPDLINGRVFFIDATGNVLESYEIVADDITSETGQDFTGVNPNAQSVYIVGNHIEITDADSKLQAATTLTALKSTGIEISTQQDNYLEAVLVNTTSTTDTYSTYDAIIYPDTEAATENSYYAKVLLGASLSRIQVADISTTDTRITSFTLSGIYIDNHYTEFTTSTDGVSTGDKFTVEQDATQLGNNTGMYDQYSDGISDGGDLMVEATDATAGATAWGYQVPATVAPTTDNETNVPSIIIHLTDVTYTDSSGKPQTKEDAYITVTSYTNADGEIVNFEAGKVYNIPTGSFVFDLSNLDDEPNAQDSDLTIFVEVKDWEVVSISPVL